MNTKTEIPIVSVCAEELKLAGYDISKVTKNTMCQIAHKMEESYLSKRFYKDLKKAADELGIPKIKK